MKNQTYRMSMLFDFYGEVLTDRQKEFSRRTAASAARASGT